MHICWNVVTCYNKGQSFMQKLWQHNIEWDEPPIEDDKKEWLEMAHDIKEAMSVSNTFQEVAS